MKKITVTDIILLVLCMGLCIGSKLLFHACGAKEDGSFMTCHWAEQAVFASSLGMTLAAAIRLSFGRRFRAGVSLGITIAAVMTALVPGVFIRLCMMQEMRCHAVMRPAVILLCIAIAVTGVVDMLLARKEADA